MLIFLKNFVFGSKEKLHWTGWANGSWFYLILLPAVGETTQTRSRCSVLLKQKVKLGWGRCQEGEGNGTPLQYSIAWKIPWMEEPGRLQSMRSLRVGHDWATSFSLFTSVHWRRKWQPTPVFLPGESQGWRSLVGCRLWGCTESGMTEAT